MSKSKWFLAGLVAFVMLFYAGSASALMIDNADTVQANWTLSGTAISLLTVDDGGGIYERRQIYDTPGAAIYTTSDYIAGDRTSYMNGSIEYNYRTLGIGSGDTWTPTLGYPTVLAIHISGGNDPSQQWIEYNVDVHSSGLGWYANQDWHTIKLAFVNGLASRDGSEFDGVAATTATLPGVINGALYTPELLENFWANISSIQVIVYGPWSSPSPNYAGAAFTDLQLVPEPATISLLVIGSVVGIMRRRK